VLHDQFKGILDAQIKRVRDILVVKTEEYATDDQLHNLRTAALLKGESIPEAAIGMMVKHTVSIFTMVKSGKSYPEALWDEKITDHIVWLILLKAALIESEQNPLNVATNASPTFVSSFLRASAEDRNAEVLIDVGDGHNSHTIPASEVLRYAAAYLESTKPNPDQERLTC
jgi:hypothetical protein